MNGDKYEPIATPWSRKLFLARLNALPWVVFVGAILVIAVLWRERVGPPTMVGQAEGALANVNTHEAGVLVGLTVNRFQKVRAGEQIGSVMIANPKLIEASVAVIRTELDLLRANLDPISAQQRTAVNYAQLRLDWMRQRADLATAKVNRQLAEAEFHRTEQLYENKIASESDLDTAKASFDALTQQVEELTQLVADGEKSFTKLQLDGGTDISHISDAPMRAAIAAYEAKLRRTEAELSPIELHSPIDGTVTAVYFRSGESVTPGVPILTIAADRATRIVGYLREPIRAEVRPGDMVEVRTRSGKREVGGATVIELGGQLEPVPVALQSPLKLAGSELALPVSISLPSTLHIRPGELLDLRVTASIE